MSLKSRKVFKIGNAYGKSFNFFMGVYALCFFKKNKKVSKPGFMLTEVLMALTIVSLIMGPIFMFISNSLRSSVRFSKQVERLFAMKNMMVEQTFKAPEEKNQLVTIEETTKKPVMKLRFERGVVKKAKPFETFSKEQLQSLCLQKVTTSFGMHGRDQLASFLYKPKL